MPDTTTLGPAVLPVDLAHDHARLAAQVEADQATSYTGDDVFAATSRLYHALGRQLAAAAYIRHEPFPAPGPRSGPVAGPGSGSVARHGPDRRWWHRR